MAVEGRSPTLETLTIVCLVFALQLGMGFIGVGVEFFALAVPFVSHPWTFVTSIYAHGSLSHLLMNAVALGVCGLLIERVTSRIRFHAFILATGMIAGTTEVLFGAATGSGSMVLGLSGAVFALMGYLVAANPVTDVVVDWVQIDRWVKFLLVLLFAVGITVVTGGDDVAMIAHFSGFVLGLLAGRLRLLHVRPRSRRDTSKPVWENTRYK